MSKLAIEKKERKIIRKLNVICKEKQKLFEALSAVEKFAMSLQRNAKSFQTYRFLLFEMP